MKVMFSFILCLDKDFKRVAQAQGLFYFYNYNNIRYKRFNQLKKSRAKDPICGFNIDL